MTESSPQVVVACAWYNRADYIRDTIDSLLAQDFDSFEIVVVNDGSTDPRVREILDSYSDPRLRVIHQENTGFTVAIRRAIDSSTAPYIALQGAGDVSYPQRLRKQWQVLSQKTEIVGVACGVRQIKFGGDTDGDVERQKIKNGYFIFEDLLQSNPITHGEVMYKRNIYKKAGEYRHFFTLGQDYDLWLRMSLHGAFFLISETLYERRKFSSESIAADPIKRLIQIRMADLAVTTAKQRKKYGKDVLDIFGDRGALFCGQEKSSSWKIKKIALKYLLANKVAETNFLADLSLSLKPNISSRLFKLFTGISWSKVAFSYIVKIVSKYTYVSYSPHRENISTKSGMFDEKIVAVRWTHSHKNLEA